MHQMCKAARSGNAKLAAELDALLEGLHQQLFVEPNPIPVKWALHTMGKIPHGIRLPLVGLSPESQAVVRTALHQAHII